MSGDDVSNTIELREIIGRNASLGHATAEDLPQALKGPHVSEALKQAAMSVDDSHLVKKLGHRDIKNPHHPNNNVGGGHDHDGSHSTYGDDKGTEDPGKSDT